MPRHSTRPHRKPPPSSTRSAPASPVEASDVADQPATTWSDDALIRLTEAEDTLRAIGAGEVDAFVLSDGGGGQSIFTLETADRPYRMFVESMRDGAATISSTGLILFANRRLAELLSCSRETIVGSVLGRFMGVDARMGLDEIRGLDGCGTTVEVELLDADGAAIPVLIGSSPLDVDGERLACLTFTDLRAQKAQASEIARLGRSQAQRMAELEDAQARLVDLATHDALTGLPNRALVVDRIDQALSHTGRSGRCTAVFFVDLDRFKHINDTQGHAAGDVVLRRIAAQLVTGLRPSDSVARIGGDEFVIVATELDSHLHAVDIATRVVLELCSLPNSVEDGERVAASVGVAISEGGRGTAEILLHEADTAMYKAKSHGGGCVEVFDAALGRQVRQRSVAQLALQSALDEGRTILRYQPVIDLRSGRVSGFEALVRIAQRDGSIMPPAEFIPVAEDSGLVVPLGARVLAAGCQEASGWTPTGAPGGGLTLAVNVSARQFEPGDLTTLVQRSLDDAGLHATRLHLELTETTIMDLHPDILRQLAEIRDMGVEIGLDDFGTGYASLTHLRRLPLSFVKIDQSFVQGVNSEAGDEGIVSAVIDLAAHLGLRSIAEGVETDDQLRRLRELGCDQAQGYLFDRPLAPTAVPATIQRFRDTPA